MLLAAVPFEGQAESPGRGFGSGGWADRSGAPGCAGGTPEAGERRARGGAPLLAREANELPAYKDVVAFEQIPPSPVPERGSLFGRSDQVCEEERREHAVRHCRLLLA